ncbi:SMAD/FHA domain-containing protein [Phycomyces blakesleeanus]
MGEFAVPAPTHAPPPPLIYDKPSWAGVATHDYKFEILKGGVQVDQIDGPKKDLVVIGRLPICEIPMEHPSVSRYHAIIQFNQEGDAFIYDLESAHGTRLNKIRIPARTHLPIKTGDQLKFGESTRVCIFETEKPSSEQDIAREEAIAERFRARRQLPVETSEDDNNGVSWGFGEDAEEDDDDDEQEGDGEGEGTASGDAALLTVDAEKLAFEDAKRRREELEIMYGDDDDDDAFYDRTERKKKKTAKAETYDELVERLKITEENLAAVRRKIHEREEQDKQVKTGEEEEDLDEFMKNLEKAPEKKQPLMLIG